MDRLDQGSRPNTPRVMFFSNPRFAALWGALTLTALGSAAAPIALASIALQATGSPMVVGLALAARLVPVVIFTLIGGAWGDRYSKSRILSICDGVNFFAQAVFGFGLLLGAEGMGVVILILSTQFLGGLASAVFSPSMRGMIPELCAENDRVRANSLISGSNAVSMIIGPILGGLSTLIWAPSTVILANSALFGISALLMRTINATSIRSKSGAQTTILQDVAVTFRVVKKTRWLKWGIILDSGFGPLFTAPILVLGPVLFAVGHGGEGVWGVLLATWAIGLLLGSVLAVHFIPPNPLRAASFMLMALPVSLFVLATNLSTIVAIVGIGLSGIASAYYGNHWTTAVQNSTEASMRSRVFAFNWLGVSLLTPIGYAASGGLASVIEIPVLLTLTGSLLAILIFWRIANPSLNVPTIVAKDQVS